MRLREIPIEVYARDVLPLTAPLWAGRRSFDEYVAQTVELARSPFGRRHCRTVGLYDGSRCVASFKRYERAMQSSAHRAAAIGFGAVFTPPEYRGRGYASVMLAMGLDSARQQGFELAYLFSDIRPAFYAALGFRAFPSRRFSLRADTLRSLRLQLSRLAADDWGAVRRTFDLGLRREGAGFVRTAAVWGWIDMCIRHASPSSSWHETNLVVRQRGRVVAYVLGARDPQRDAYLLLEFGYTDDAAHLVPALLRGAAGDLRRITGWLPPAAARELLPRPAVSKRTRALLMMAPLRAEGAQFLSSVRPDSRGDFCWSGDHI